MNLKGPPGRRVTSRSRPLVILALRGSPAPVRCMRTRASMARNPCSQPQASQEPAQPPISAEQRRLEPERWELLRDDELAGDDSLEDLGCTVDLATATQAQRQAEDGIPLPRGTEDGMPWLFDPVARQIYTPPAMHRPPELCYSCGAVYGQYGRCGSRFHGEHAWKRPGARQPPAARKPRPHGAGCCRTARPGRAQQVSRTVSRDVVTVPFAFTVTCIRMCCLPSDPSEPCRTMLSATVKVFASPPNRSVKWPV